MQHCEKQWEYEAKGIDRLTLLEMAEMRYKLCRWSGEALDVYVLPVGVGKHCHWHLLTSYNVVVIVIRMLHCIVKSETAENIRFES